MTVGIDVSPGQTWQCNEARAEPDNRPDAHDVQLWAALPRFAGVVDDVQDGLVTLTVTTGNDHPRTPDAGQKVDVAVAKLRDQARWRRKRASGRGGPADA